MKKLFSLLAIACLSANGYAQSEVTLTEETVTMPTYVVAPADKNPIFFRNEAFQGAERHYYPLKMNDQYTGERVDRGHKMVVLGNEYIELGVAPDIGGKLYYATDKTNGYNFIYKNNVVRPSNIGMTGAWVSGGIEWDVLHHHRASTFLQLDYTTVENSDGSKTIWVAEHEPRHGMRWTVGVTVFPGKSYFKAEGRIFNSTPLTHSFLYWANVAVHVNENYQTIFPPSEQVVTFHSKTDFTQWPNADAAYRGVELDTDISWWKNVVNSNSFFIHDHKADFMGGYDHGKDAGTVHFGDHNIVKGAKLWEWGSGPGGQITEGRLTETDGPYAEIMVGAFSDNQPDYCWIRPYEVKKWEQYWYPVRGIGGFKYANLNGAVNLEEKEDKKGRRLFLGYYSTASIERAKVVLACKGETVFEQVVAISPENPFVRMIKLDGVYRMEELHTSLVDESTGEVLVEYRPEEHKPVSNENLPEKWEGYRAPETLGTLEEIYLMGKRIEQFYAPMYDPMDWYEAVLEKDPNDMRTNTAVGNIYLKNGDYDAAEKYLDRAIRRATDDYTIPSSHEALYLQGLILRNMGRLAEAEELFYRATWDYAYHSAAYFQLAELSCAKKDFGKALEQIDESLWTNARNNSAIALKASILREIGDFRGAAEILGTIAGEDPLDFRLRNEYYLIAKASGDSTKADELLLSLDKEMRDFDDNYFQLAIGYLNNGLLADAEEVLKRFNGKNPFVDYYLGYIYDIYGDREQALRYFDSAAKQPVDGVFPYRLGSIDVLKKALEYNPTDGNAPYYMGNILYEKQPEVAIGHWEKAVQLNPGLAIAYRNLGWGYYYHYKDIPKAIAMYEQAISLNRSDAMYYTELSDLYQKNNTSIEKRMAIFEGSEDVVKNRDDSHLWMIENLILSGQADKAVEMLDNTVFAYREGSSRTRDITIDANLIVGKRYFDCKEYKKALELFMKADITKEEAGYDRLGEREIQVDYYIGTAWQALGNRAKANAAFRKSVAHPSQRLNIMSYYRGLSFVQLGETKKAEEVFKALIAEADEALRKEASTEVGVIFGGAEGTNDRLSRLHTMRGLGYKGLGESQKAKTELNKAIELSQSNLWARSENF